MKDVFSQNLKNFNGMPLKIESEDCTLGYVAITALLGTYPDERELPGPEKAKRYVLAKRIHEGTADLPNADIVLIKSLVGKCFVPLIVGAAFEILDSLVSVGPVQPEPAIEVAVIDTPDTRKQAVEAAVEKHYDRVARPGRRK